MSDAITKTDVDIIGAIAAVPMILRVASHITGMRFTAIARVTDTTWTACAVRDDIEFGLKAGDTLDLQTTICDEIRQHHMPVIIDRVADDPAFRDHHTPKMYGFQSYISVPIFRTDGTFFGTLCAIDPLPAKLGDASIRETFELFGQLIAAQLDMEDRVRQSATALDAAHSVATLREQFIAVLGHDLRNPLQAVSMAAEVLQALRLDARADTCVHAITQSTQRMEEMIDNILDFARGRLGGGIPVALREVADVGREVLHAVAEVRSAYPDRQFSVNVSVPGVVLCDSRRLAQLLVNLLVNATVHGTRDTPVQVTAVVLDQMLEISVANHGEIIPPAKLVQLFQPFSRAAEDGPREGLGLGLYIAAEIARAHGGSLGVVSTADAGTCFTFRMPMLAQVHEPA